MLPGRSRSQSERTAGPGSVHEDADDLAELIEALGLAPAHVVANSYGSIVALDAAIRRPEVFATLLAHEPPLTGTLTETQFEPVLREVNRRVGRVIELLDAGDDEAGRSCSSRRSLGGRGHGKKNSLLS